MEIVKNESVGGSSKMALAFILWNEGETIGEVIKSFHVEGVPLYDYLVIGIDEKTDDNTYDVVRKFCPESNIQFFNFQESGRFAGSRNKLIKECENLPIDWIFMPDGHEFLRPESQKALKALLDTRTKNLRMISPWLELGKYGHITPFYRPMLFRTKSGIYFKSDEHNYLYDPKRVPAAKTPQIHLVHRMPSEREKVRKKQRVDWNLPGFLKRAGTSNEPRDYFYVGISYHDLKDYDKSVEWFTKCLDVTSYKNRDLACQAAIFLCDVFVIREEFDKLLKYAFIAMQNKWDRAEPYSYLGWRAGILGRKHPHGSAAHLTYCTQSAHWFTIAAHTPPPVSNYQLCGPDYAERPWDGLMEMLANIGNLDGSLFAAKKVLTFWPDNERVLKNIRILEEGIQKRNNEIDPSYKKELELAHAESLIAYQNSIELNIKENQESIGLTDPFIN